MTGSFEPFSSAAALFLPHRVSTQANIIWHRRRDTMAVLLKTIIHTFHRWFVVASSLENSIYKLMEVRVFPPTES